MIHAYHLILGAYGFWLPNDPRGSWSDFVGAWNLLRFGSTTKTCERRPVALDERDVAFYAAAKKALKYPAVHFTGLQARAIARGFATFAATSELRVYTCAILPEHIHLVIGRHRYKVEQIANLLKGAATRQLNEEGIHPLRRFKTRSGRCPNAFSRGEWKVFIDSEPHLRNAIAYVENNPIREGLRPQRWRFVVPL